MNSAITPYRSSAEMSIQPGKLTSGFLRIVRPPPPHKCETPGFWFHFWLWITGRAVKEGDLFRCSICYRLYAYGLSSWMECNPVFEDSFRKFENQWVQAGGSLEKVNSKLL